MIGEDRADPQYLGRLSQTHIEGSRSCALLAQHADTYVARRRLMWRFVVIWQTKKQRFALNSSHCA